MENKFKCLFEHEKEYILKVWRHYKSLEFHERVKKTADDLGILKTILLNRLSVYGEKYE